MDRYTVQRGTDSQGHAYATGPLTFYTGDDLGAAQHEAIARGGEVIDHAERRAWAPGMGWYDVSDYLAAAD